jgi:nucleotide-binding universal stress UspA family protein
MGHMPGKGWEPVSVRTILLGIEGHQDDEMAVAVVCETMDLRSATLRIVNVLTVPMTAPLDVPMPEVESRASRMLESAGKVAREFGTSRVETAVLRGRTVSETLLEEARRIDPIAIVVRLRSQDALLEHRVISSTVSAVLAGAACPVVTIHMPHQRFRA